MKCLVAIARSPDEPAEFRECHDDWEELLPENTPGWDFDFQYEERRFEGIRLERICRARNALVERITDHDVVLFIDSDIVEMSAGIPGSLWDVNPGGITAPLVLIEHTITFYDTSGFLEDGQPCGHIAPFFRQLGSIVDLDSVGGVYLAPASLFRDDGVRFSVQPGDLTDHFRVCQAAKDLGIRVACLTQVVAYHAYLPNYGIAWREQGT